MIPRSPAKLYQILPIFINTKVWLEFSVFFYIHTSKFLPYTDYPSFFAPDRWHQSIDRGVQPQTELRLSLSSLEPHPETPVAVHWDPGSRSLGDTGLADERERGAGNRLVVSRLVARAILERVSSCGFSFSGGPGLL